MCQPTVHGHLSQVVIMVVARQVARRMYDWLEETGLARS